jgi:hypothetical protein
MEEIDFTSILDEIGMIVKLRAIQLCPVDLGTLRRSIKHKVSGNKVTIYTEVDYAQDMEYGKPPGVLDESEKEELKGWAKRHGIPTFAVIRKIETKGIEVGTPKNPLETAGHTFRPFMRPALHQSIPNIRELIKNRLGGK